MVKHSLQLSCLFVASLGACAHSPGAEVSEGAELQGNQVTEPSPAAAPPATPSPAPGPAVATEPFCAGKSDVLTIDEPTYRVSYYEGAHTDDVRLSCGVSLKADLTAKLRLPVPVEQLTVRATMPLTSVDQPQGSSAHLALFDASCDTQLACRSEAQALATGQYQTTLVTGPLAKGEYAVIVEHGDSIDDYWDVEVRGVVGTGKACDDPLFAIGVLACANGCQRGRCL